MKAFITTAVTAAVLLCGCNTVSGFGRDISATGHAISRASHH